MHWLGCIALIVILFGSPPATGSEPGQTPIGSQPTIQRQIDRHRVEAAILSVDMSDVSLREYSAAGDHLAETPRGYGALRTGTSNRGPLCALTKSRAVRRI